MKKTSLILSIIATVISCALLVLFLVLVLPKNNSKGTASEPGEKVTTNGQVAYIQLDSLISKYDMYNDLNSALESKANKAQGDLQRRSNKLKSDMNTFENNVNKGLIIRSEAQRQQQDLLQRQQTLENDANNKQAELQEENQVMLNRVIDALETYIKKYNEDHKYSLIFTTTGLPGSIVIGDPALDITEEVVDAMNREYVKKRNSNKSDSDSNTEQ
ncbi:MAG: OmpH family outer membrane protein [Bacteroidales bacterium]|jgi:outer membrane protein|nr:OmpH family outer membrane protein [Bacteroidales bacterium]MCI2122037.1 OmpH family outer membrane protein [Bacteroidales bacterium]MCI2145334.1 OmpH family outer membrane protein [Bacteroidales bacterium]